jgi:hypothetical protein
MVERERAAWETATKRVGVPASMARDAAQGQQRDALGVY